MPFDKLTRIGKRYGLPIMASGLLLCTALTFPSVLSVASLLWPLPLFLRYRSRVREAVKHSAEGASKAKALETRVKQLEKANKALDMDLRYARRLLEVAEDRFVTKESGP
jgi:hypothetical protein